MKKCALVIFGCMVMFLSVRPAFAVKDPYIFPKEGQSKEQTASDKTTCETWAEDETGVNPDVIKAQIESAKDPYEKEGSQVPGFLGKVFKGAATGAAVGAIGSNVDNQVGRTAAQGAVLGGVLTHEKNVDKAEEEKIRKEVQRQDVLNEQYDEYVRAFSVCMEAKGYSVK